MKMKTLLTGLLFVLITGTSYSQDCIKKFVGTYGINLDGTIAAVREADPSKENEEVPQEFLDMLKQITLKITTDSIVINMMGREQSVSISSRVSEIEGGACDMVISIPDGQLPEGVEVPFLTIHEGKDGYVMLKSTNGNKDMDYYVWQKIE
jgi:hypothetical protein